jgi:hypothetical protein
MVATEFDATSDRRIKKDFVASESDCDLNTLAHLSVTDFKYVDDQAYGKDYKKGFVAQEVEKIFPEAVQTHTDYIPSIYAMSAAASYNSITKELTVTLAKPHDMVVGDMVKTSTPEKDDNRNKVTRIINDKTFVVEDWKETNTDAVFVYGKLVSDYRTVDYDRIYTLNVSATQELAKQVLKLQQKNTTLERENSTIKSDVNKLKASVEMLESIVGSKAQK